MPDPGRSHSERSPELQALLDEIAAGTARERALRSPATPVGDAAVTAPPPVHAPPAESAPIDAGSIHAELVHGPSAPVAIAGPAPRRSRRAMALAGAVAAAVVAVVVIAVGAGSPPAQPPPAPAGTQNFPMGYAVVASVGTDDQNTVVTVTPPMTTVDPTSPGRPTHGSTARPTTGSSSVGRLGTPRTPGDPAANTRVVDPPTSGCIAITLPPVPVAGGSLPTGLTFPCP